MQELKIEYISPKELTPYENNTRKHAPDDIEQIKKSILVDGFNDPIGIWGDQNLIVEGHGRQIASLELHLEKVPCIRLDHMTDKQRRDYAIRHNRTAELSAWDFTKLEEEIAQLEIEGSDFKGLKFEFAGIEDMEMPEALDEDGVGKRNVVCQLNFPSSDAYESVKDELQRIADENGALLAVKMA